MKIFISWSGQSSRLVAEALSDWLQRVIQAVKPFYSPDIDKGAKWSNEIDAALEGTRFGIICLTPDNLKSEWIHYESGALSKTKDASIWTFLLDLKPSDVKQPLGRFQHTLAEKVDVLKMLKSINAKLSEVGGESLKENLLEEIFTESWSKLEARLEEAKKSTENQSDKEIGVPIENIRTDNDKLDEILEILRNQQRYSNNGFVESLPDKYKVKADVYNKVTFSLAPLTKILPPDEIKEVIKQIFKVSLKVSIRSNYKIVVDFDSYLTEDTINSGLMVLIGLTDAAISDYELVSSTGVRKRVELW